MDELGHLAPAFGGHALDGMKASLRGEGGRRRAPLIRSSRGHEALIGGLRVEELTRRRRALARQGVEGC